VEDERQRIWFDVRENYGRAPQALALAGAGAAIFVGVVTRRYCDDPCGNPSDDQPAATVFNMGGTIATRANVQAVITLTDEQARKAFDLKR
jgi:hypothetical protein